MRDQLYCQRYKVFPTSRAANSKGRSSSHAAAGPQKATNARNQRSRNSYPRFRPRQSPARPKPRYNAKSRARRSSIYARFCLSLAPRRRCKQPRPETSVAGTDRAQRGQNPIYARFCVSLALRRCCKQRRPKTRQRRGRRGRK